MGRNGHSCTHRQPRIMARYRSNVFSEGPGRQKGLFRARYSRNVFPNTVFHCFSPLKTYIRSLCCQQHAVRACISATYCHEEAFLPSGPPLGIHDNRFLPLFNAQPFHAGHSGGRPASGQRRMREGRLARGQRRIRESACKRPAQDKGKRLTRGQRRMRGDAWRGTRADREGVSDWRLARREQGRFGLAAHQTGTGAIPIGEPRDLIGGVLRSASALAFLLRSPFRSQLRQAPHRARNR